MDTSLNDISLHFVGNKTLDHNLILSEDLLKIHELDTEDITISDNTEKIQGKIEFKNSQFSYENRKENIQWTAIFGRSAYAMISCSRTIVPVLLQRLAFFFLLV